MNRSTASIVLLITLIAVSTVDTVAVGALFVLQVIPLCGIAMLFGYMGLALAFAYLLLLQGLLFSIDISSAIPLWQVVVVTAMPVIVAWVTKLRAKKIDLERMLRNLLEGMRDGVILSGVDHTVHLINPAALKLLHLPAAPQDCLPHFRELGITAQWDTCLARGNEPVSAEYRVESRVLHVTATSVFEKGCLMGFVTTVVDYTAERDITLMREEFLALVSHELRNPLTSVHGFAELLAVERRPERVTRYARVIGQNTDRMLRLIHDLLQLRSMDAGSFQLQRKQVDLVALIHQVTDAMSLKLMEAGISVQSCGTDESLYGEYDPDRLSQVFTNLLDNAMKYTPHGSTIRITLTAEPEKVLVEVRDNGPGIPAHELERVFEKYYQAKSGRMAGQGAGLGLAICRGLVEMHHGKIWATSTGDVGTSVWVSLPRQACTAESWQLPDSLPPYPETEAAPSCEANSM